MLIELFVISVAKNLCNLWLLFRDYKASLQLSRHGEGRCRSGARILYKSAFFYAKQSQFTKSQMNVKLIITMDYEKKPNRTFGENKPKQSQSVFFTAENAEFARLGDSSRRSVP